MKDTYNRNHGSLGVETEIDICEKFDLTLSGVNAYDAVDEAGNYVEIKTLCKDDYKPEMVRAMSLHKSRGRKDNIKYPAANYFIFKKRGENGEPNRYFSTRQSAKGELELNNSASTDYFMYKGPDSPLFYRDLNPRYYKGSNKLKKVSSNVRTQLLVSCEIKNW